MSSAAKLHRFGKGTAAVAIAAITMTAFGPTAFAWPDRPVAPGAGGGASVGLVDTDQKTPENEGATLLQAGAADQALGDMRLVVPNTFANGDVIDIYFFDREASGNANTPATDGSLNIDAGHQFTLSKAPSVAVHATPYAGATQVDPNSNAVAANTERPNGLVDFASVPNAPKPVAPKLVAELEKGTNAYGNTPNVIRLRVDGSSAKGDASAKWIVTLSGAQVTLGGEVSPGEIRAVPFARTATSTPGQYTNSPMFVEPSVTVPLAPVAPVRSDFAGGPVGDGEYAVALGAYVDALAAYNALANNIDTNPTLAGYQYNIAVYTVPAYVSPVKVTQAEPTAIAGDNTPQNVGAVTITETQSYSMAAGSYTVWVTGANVMNTSTDKVVVELIDPATGETVTTTGIPGAAAAVPGSPGVTGTPVVFDLVQNDAVAAKAKVSSVKLSNMKLQSAKNGPIEYRITGGSINGSHGFLTNASNTNTAVPDSTMVLPPANAFGGSVNQDGTQATAGILAPTDELVLRGSANAGISAIGGNNRYETARKIAKEWSPLGDEAIIASGENYPDALSSGFLSQRLGAPIILTMNGSVPADTMESLRERGVRKVYIIGGESAVSKAVSDKLLATPSYMWSDSSKNLVPRGGNMEVVRLGGASRYSTNALVNMYAAAQYTGVAVVGKTTPTYGAALKTTAMIARGDNFADALAANVLTSGMNTGAFVRTGSAGTTSYELGSTNGGATVASEDLSRIGAGSYSFVRTGPLLAPIYRLQRGTDIIATQASVGSSRFNLPGGDGVIKVEGTFLAGGSSFTVVAATTGVTGEWVPRLENLNALPVILTPHGELGEQAKSELSTLHIEHALVIGGESAIPDAVVKGIDGMNVTTRRLSGVDRYDTAAAVNSYAWTPSVGSSTNTTPGLGFDGGKTVVDGTTHGQGEAFLANGTRFPDALVAGPWVSRRHDAMVLTLQSSIPEPTKKFLSDNAAVLDRAIGLGLGAAVSSAVITEANRLVSSK